MDDDGEDDGHGGSEHTSDASSDSEDMEDDEEDRIYLADNLTLHSRLGCQAIVKGDVTVEIPDVLDFIRHGSGS